MKVGQKVFTEVSQPSTQSTKATGSSQNTQAGGASMSMPEPPICSDDNPPMSTAFDSPSARMLREGQAATMTAGARQTGAEGTGQGDGPSGRPELTAEQAEAKRKEAREDAENAVGIAVDLVGKKFGAKGEAIAAFFKKRIVEKVLDTPLPTAQEGGGTAGASSTNPLDRAWDTR